MPLCEAIQSEIIAWFWVILAFMLINGTLGQARVIPSGSMENTLLIGDHLIMSRVGYDAGVPFTNWHVPLWRNPNRQQIIIFKPPFDPAQPDYVKRVIGLPGDTVDIKRWRGVDQRNKDCMRINRWPDRTGPGRASAPPGYEVTQVPLQRSGQLLFRDGRQSRQFLRQPFLGLRPTERHFGHARDHLYVAGRAERCVELATSLRDFWPTRTPSSIRELYGGDRLFHVF